MWPSTAPRRTEFRSPLHLLLCVLTCPTAFLKSDWGTVWCWSTSRGRSPPYPPCSVLTNGALPGSAASVRKVWGWVLRGISGFWLRHSIGARDWFLGTMGLFREGGLPGKDRTVLVNWWGLKAGKIEINASLIQSQLYLQTGESWNILETEMDKKICDTK